MASKLIIALGVLLLSGVLTFNCTVFADDDPDLVALGKVLFFDKNLSTPNGQSCASCHSPEAGFAHPNQALPTSQGALKICFGDRNAPSSAYAAFSPTLQWDSTPTMGNMMQGMYVGGLFWDGRANTLEEQAQKPFLNPLEMHNPNMETVVQTVRTSQYAYLFEEVFGPNPFKNVETAYQNIAQAIAAYERSVEMIPFSSKFDLYLDGQVQLTAAEANGLALFAGKGKCVNCHSMTYNPDPERFPELKPLFTNFGYQNVGAPPNPDNPYYNLPKGFNPLGKNYVDLALGAVLAGRGDPNADVTNASAQKQNGKFKIPSLRNVAVTAPYEHNGVFKTLKDVVRFNNTRDVPGGNSGADWPAPEVAENVHRHMPPMPGFFGQLGLTDQEVDDIVAFLETLTDGHVPEQ
jgi:cytochrome c peroxidase